MFDSCEVEDETCCWYLALRNYKAYGLPLYMLSASMEILSHQSDNSMVDRPCIIHCYCI